MSNMNELLLKFRSKHFIRLLLRNKYTTTGEKAVPMHINLEWVSNNNLGDELVPVIYKWMLDYYHLNPEQEIGKTIHMMTLGSMVGSWNFDAVIWGSGVHTFYNIRKLSGLRHVQKFDVRAVRGPITKSALESCGHDCPAIYGDPAVLMPLIYCPQNTNKSYDASVVFHYRTDKQWISKSEHLKSNPNLNFLNIGTNDYKQYIKQMLLSKKIISSSLHGIILAEAYGIPALFLNTGGYVSEALMKYYDWYYSTTRFDVKMAMSLDEAIQMDPMPLPDLKDMQERLINVFPYDLWEL